MKNTFGILLIALLLMSCKQKIESGDISKINGYWEIEKVVLEDGSQKEYGANQSYDYFQIDKNSSGIRKKVMPQLDGSFLVNNTYEALRVRFSEDRAYLDYTTPYMKWSEEIIVLNDQELVVLNTNKIEYHYKKTGALKLEGYGKKTK